MSARPRDDAAASGEERRTTPLRRGCGHPHACSADVRLRVLHQVALFEDLGRDELADVNRLFHSEAWSAGELLYAEGDPAENLYVLASGSAKAFHSTMDGDEVVVDVLAPGDLFGGLNALGHDVHGESVAALTTTCALRVDPVTFREILTAHPVVALRALDDVSARLADSRRTVTRQATEPVEQRVAATLVRLAGKFGEPHDGGLLIQLPLSRADLAGMAGTTTESVSRTMSRFRKDGLVESGRRWTLVRDRAALENIAAGV